MKRTIALGIALVMCAAIISGCVPKELRTAKIELGTRKKPRPNPNIERVKENLTLAMELYPDNPEVYYLWGWVQSMEGNYEEMVIAFDKSVELSPKFKADCDTIRMTNWDELIQKANSAHQNEDYESALTLFESCIICWPLRYEPYWFGGDAAYRIDQIEKAYELSKRAYEIEPDSIVVVQLYANMAMVNQKFDEAEAILQELIERDPTNAMNLFSVGDIYNERNDTTKAVEYYQRALEIDKDNKEGWLSLGLIYFQMQNFCKAAESFERFVSFGEAGTEDIFIYLLSMYQCSDKEDNLRSLKTELEKFTMENPSHCDGWQLIANTYLRLKMKKEAIEANKKLEDCKGK